MFTPRNVIFAVVTIFVCSIVGTCVSLMQPPDGGGVRDDSFGTRAQGHRALFETLKELGVAVERGLHPPEANSLEGKTLVLWNPQPSLVSSDPSFLSSLQPWIESGGRVVVAVGEDDSHVPESLQSKSLLPTSVFKALGLGHLSIQGFTTSDGSGPKPNGGATMPPNVSNLDKLVREEVDYTKLAKQYFGAGQETHAIRITTLSVKATGTLERFNSLVQQVSVNPDSLSELAGTSGPPANVQPSGTESAMPRVSAATGSMLQTDDAVVGTIVAKDSSSAEHVIAASVRHGRGEIVVLSLPSLAHNLNVSAGDNAVLLLHLMAGSPRGLVFDEFYHGLTIRGNPMWLFAQRTYGTVALMLLLATSVFAWRRALFLGPPIGLPIASRRSLGEYLDAMSRFLLNGRGAAKFIVREVRAGLVWSVRKECGLAPQKEDVGDAVAVIVRRDPIRARHLQDTVQRLDSLLASRGSLSESVALSELKQVTPCLSQNAIKHFVKKS